jgi:V8-like Glu-specific endopeptidase
MKISISFVQEKKIYDEDLFLVDESDMKQKLHRSIGALSFLTPNKRVAAGSGVLISRNLILTAAHNLYDKVKG